MLGSAMEPVNGPGRKLGATMNDGVVVAVSVIRRRSRGSAFFTSTCQSTNDIATRPYLPREPATTDEILRGCVDRYREPATTDEILRGAVDRYREPATTDEILRCGVDCYCLYN